MSPNTHFNTYLILEFMELTMQKVQEEWYDSVIQMMSAINWGTYIWALQNCYLLDWTIGLEIKMNKL